MPDKFTFTLNPLRIVLACTIKTSPPPVGLTLDVTKGQPQSHPGSGSTPAGTGNGGQPEGTGSSAATPTGAPETGGGTGPGADMAVAAGGAAIVVSGGGLVLLGRRRSGRRPR
jgi:hypothetical protein